MTRVQQALEQLGRFPGFPQKLIEQYILTGDRKALSQIQPAQNGGWSWEGTVLAKALAPLRDWTDDDRRVLHVMFARMTLGSLGEWLNDVLRKEKPGDDIVAAVRAELASLEATASGIDALFRQVHVFARDGKPTSAGRYVLSIADPDLRNVVQQGVFDGLNVALVEFLVEFAPDRIPPLFPVLLTESSGTSNNAYAARLMLRKGGARFEKEVHDFFQSMKNTWYRFHLAQEFFEVDPVRYRQEALEAASFPGRSVAHQ